MIRAYLRYDLINFAIEQTLSLIRKVSSYWYFRSISVTYVFNQSNTLLTNEKPRGKFATWLPYTLIDQILVATEPQDSLPSSTRALVQDLRAEIANRLKHVESLGQGRR